MNRRLCSAIAAASTASIAASPPATPQQFDLVCTGTQRGMNYQTMTIETTDFAQEFRLDLTAKTYCADDCKSVGNLEAVTPEKIIFEQTNKQQDPTLPTETWLINRVDGKYFYALFGPKQSPLSRDGNCVKEAFKSINAPQTKF